MTDYRATVNLGGRATALADVDRLIVGAGITTAAGNLSLATAGAEGARLTTTGALLFSGTDKRIGAANAGAIYIAPFADGAGAVEVRKADNTTAVFSVNTTTSVVTLANMSVTGTASFSGQISGAVGSASAPTYAVAGDTNTGLNLLGGDSLALVTGGINAFTLDAAGNAVLRGTLDIQGGTTLIESTVVNIADRVVHYNHSSGVAAVPAAITGFSIHRGATAGPVDRDHAALIWVNDSSVVDPSAGTGFFRFAAQTGGDDATVGTDLDMQARQHRVSAASGMGIQFVTDNAADIGAVGATRPRTVYAGTSVIVGNSITMTTNTLSASGSMAVTSVSNLDLGTSSTTSVAIGHSGITTTVTGGLSQGTGAVSLTPNAASALTTSAGALTLTSAATATWSSAAALTLDAATILNLGTTASTSISIGHGAITTTVTGTLSVGTLLVTTQVLGPNGTAASPGFAFASPENDIGLYVVGINQLGIATAGINTLTFSETAGVYFIANNSGNLAFSDSAVSALGGSSTSIGYLSDATGTSSSAYGKSAQATGSNSCAFGVSATVSVADGCAFGTLAVVSQAGGTAVGVSASCSGGTLSTALGSAAVCSQARCVAVGYGASCSGNTDSVIIGELAVSTTNGACGFGQGVSISATNGIGIGTGALIDQVGSMGFGRDVRVTAAQQVVFGAAATNKRIAGVYFGAVTDTAPLANTVINASGGSGTNISGSNLVLAAGLGTGSAATQGQIIFQTGAVGASGATLQTATTTLTLSQIAGVWFIPNNSGKFAISDSAVSALGSNATSVGYLSDATGSGATAYGNTAQATGTDSTAIGHNAAASNTNSLALGNGATCSGDSSIAIGLAATASQNSCVTVGGTCSGGTISVAIGYGSACTQQGCVSVGQLAVCSGATQSVAVGNMATATAGAGVAVGSQAASGFIGSQAYGRQAATTAAQQVVFGSANTNARVASVYFGPVTDATPLNTSINSSGASGTDIAGASLTIAGGQSTGSGAGGSIVFSTAAAGGTGVTVRTVTARYTIDSTGILTMNGNTDFIPGTTGQGRVGTTTNKFLEVNALTVTSGDLHLRDEERGAHWMLREEPDCLMAFNKMNGKKYRVMLEEVQ